MQGSSKLSTQREASRNASTHSPSPSPDPLLLFTPPRRSASPTQRPIRVSSPASSPLTPASSPTKAAEAPRTPSPSPLQAVATSRQQNSTLSAAEIAAIEDAAAAERARYSLRARNPRQLNPYEYDKLLYKRQMRAAPEAIVKVVSPPRPRRRHRSTSANPRDASSGAEDEYQAGEEDLDDEESQARRRRKGKDTEQEGVAEEEDGKDGNRGRVEKWLPEALRESSSSSEDDADVLLGLMPVKRKKPYKEKRSRRARPFPMKKKDLQRSVSPAKAPVSPLPAYLRHSADYIRQLSHIGCRTNRLPLSIDCHLIPKSVRSLGPVYDAGTASTHNQMCVPKLRTTTVVTTMNLSPKPRHGAAAEALHSPSRIPLRHRPSPGRALPSMPPLRETQTMTFWLSGPAPPMMTSTHLEICLPGGSLLSPIPRPQRQSPTTPCLGRALSTCPRPRPLSSMTPSTSPPIPNPVTTPAPGPTLTRAPNLLMTLTASA